MYIKKSPILAGMSAQPEVDELKAALKKREQQLFGRGSEKQTTHQDRLNAEQAAKANNLAQRGMVDVITVTFP